MALVKEMEMDEEMGPEMDEEMGLEEAEDPSSSQLLENPHNLTYDVLRDIEIPKETRCSKHTL